MKSPGLAAAGGVDSAAGDELQLLLDRSDLTALIGGVSPRKGGKMTEVRLLPPPPPLLCTLTRKSTSSPILSPSPTHTPSLRPRQVCRSRPLSATSFGTLSAREEDGELQAARPLPTPKP